MFHMSVMTLRTSHFFVSPPTEEMKEFISGTKNNISDGSDRVYCRETQIKFVS